MSGIKREYTIVIDKGESKLNDDLEIYTNDVGVSIYFNILNSPYIKLSNQTDLYAKVVLRDKLGNSTESNVVPVVNNIVIFTLDNKIMNSLTETGKYQLYIVIMDDKRNKKVLPPINMTLVETDLLLNELETSSIGATINETAIENYGNELILFNLDGTYNRTLWVVGDIITTSKMNKIEKAISKLTDTVLSNSVKIDSFNDNEIHQTLVGTEAKPITISNLEKGFYIISGEVRDFSTDVAYTLTGENYFMVTYYDAYESRISRCKADEKEFHKYKYDKNQKTVFNNEQEIHTIPIVEGFANVTEDRCQFLNVSADVEVQLPSPNTFAEINLYVMSTKEGANIKLPTISWDNVPVITQGKMCKLSLAYINDLWYGYYTPATNS